MRQWTNRSKVNKREDNDLCKYSNIFLTWNNKLVEKEQQHQRLSAERQLYEKTKKELNQKLREQKEISDKEIHQSQLRFNSLQQQYKILVTKHDDLDQHCTQVQKDLSTENDELKRKIDHIQAQNSKIQTSKDNDITVWKVFDAT